MARYMVTDEKWLEFLSSQSRVAREAPEPFFQVVTFLLMEGLVTMCRDSHFAIRCCIGRHVGHS